MLKEKTFYTIFPPAENVHLLKDVGMIPYVLYKEYGYNSVFACFKNGDYPALDDEVKGLKMDFIETDKNYKFGKPSLSVVKYIYKKAKYIDVLNLYHYSAESFLYGFVYKMRNPAGILYFKLDLNKKRFMERNSFFKMKLMTAYYKKTADLISYELDNTGSYLKSVFPSLQDKLIKISNGIDDLLISKQKIKIKSFEEKENLIILVGRIGAPEKNHEMMLNALKDVHLNDWSVVFIGPVEEEFKKTIEQFYLDNPHLKDRVSFIGPIYERTKLYDWYNRAKVFCLTSKWESFGIVLIEALYFKNYIITTPIQPAKELTKNEMYGRIVSSEEDLTLILQLITKNNIDLNHNYISLHDYASKFTWTNIINNLNKKLNQLLA